jgi:hypothetical protein
VSALPDAAAFHPHGFHTILECEPDAHHLGLEWTISGDEDCTSFDNVSLTPSVDASKYGHWHGMITDGMCA